MDAARGPLPSLGASHWPTHDTLGEPGEQLRQPPQGSGYLPLWWGATLPVTSRAEDSPSGLGRTIGNRVGVDSPSRVQIPHPPPVTSANARDHDRLAARNDRRGVHQAETRSTGSVERTSGARLVVTTRELRQRRCSARRANLS
jgi:hypothetical protein